MKKQLSDLPLAERLTPVPTLEGYLLYDPLDFLLDRPLTFYGVVKKNMRRELRGKAFFKKAVRVNDVKISQRKRYPNTKPMLRRHIGLHLTQGVLWWPCAALTLLCYTGFRPADPRRWVTDHINGDTLDDRPSNLQRISQKENIRRSEACREHLRCLHEAQKKKH